MRAARIFAGIATFIAAAIPFAANAAVASPPACSTPPVPAPSGQFCGSTLTVGNVGGPTDVYLYAGIRYGQAQRWTAPKLIKPVRNIVAATAFGPICPQDPVPGVAIGQSEDCLFLNIWTPTRNSAAALPVMVFIHGGSFTSGAGQQPIYRGARLAASGKVIVVTISYRLGALGFLAGGSGVNALAGNYGFLDQQLALLWVHKNIRSFGGDPGTVMIFGESAGAISVGAHLVAPSSRKLFRDAIMESNPYGIPLKTRQQAARVRKTFNEAIDVAACKGELGCLERMPAATIVSAQNETAVATGFNVLRGMLAYALAWSPYVDGGLIASQPNEAAIAQPVIAGTNRDEGTLFVGGYFAATNPKGIPDPEYRTLVRHVFGQNAAAILALRRYQPDGKGNLRPLSNLVGDYFFSCATRRVLARATGPRFGYAFDHPPSFAVWPDEVKQCNPPSGQVCHAVELPFVFRNPINVNLPTVQHRFTPAERGLVDAISSYWRYFAADGDPNSGAAKPAAWPSFGAAGVRQVLDLKIAQTRDRALNCPMWDSIGYNRGAALFR